MASIPNLNTLRTGRRGPRLRGQRDSRLNAQGENDHVIDAGNGIDAARDKIIQQTDHDASSSRMSAVSMGYLDDPYAKTFFPQGVEISKRYPIINRGTYVRTKAIDKLVTRFLENEPDQRKQIVSLGAGSDTRFFRLCAGKSNVVYHEIDFETNVIPKRAAIRASKDLARLATVRDAGASHHLHALDLRDLTAKSPAVIPGLDADLPTLIISECCLCYLSPDIATSVVQYFAMNISAPLGIILYEPIRPFDAFGKTMVSNLGSRGIHLQTLKRYYSLEAQRRRLRLAGFESGQGGRDVHQLWEDTAWVSSAERERIEQLEWLDEVEEWKLLASHYCVAWGWRGQTFDTAWRDVDGSKTFSENADDEML